MLATQPRQDSGNARTVAVLVDFDNVTRSGGLPNATEMRHGLLEHVRTALHMDADVEWVTVRFYGGWRQADALSRSASDVLGLVALAGIFPMVIPRTLRVVRGVVGLATELLSAPRVPLGDTLRRRSGPPRVRLSQTPFPSGCALAHQDCPAKAVARFTKAAGKVCPSSTCNVTAGAAFQTNEQKMVDTLLAADLLHLVNEPHVTGVLVVSSDTDLLPPLVQAAQRHQAPVANLSDNRLPASAATSLQSAGVRIFAEGASWR